MHLGFMSSSLPDRVRAGEVPRSWLRGRRRRRSWLSAGRLWILITWMRKSWSMPQLSGLCEHDLKDQALRMTSPSVPCSGRRPTSCGNGWWSWRPTSLTSVRNLNDRNMTWVIHTHTLQYMTNSPNYLSNNSSIVFVLLTKWLRLVFFFFLTD